MSNDFLKFLFNFTKKSIHDYQLQINPFVKYNFRMKLNSINIFQRRHLPEGEEEEEEDQNWK
ncbi:hypothetical protein T01_1030 [Trichinella spiralis]|uniref:Uncharacterized protein n=1 Tax=Trichinella spiralis TaxID=6334 RepID=A0A0V1AXC7_TRISP|nr:hypothetical protein T01_1030 [Trichinella spiralis]